MQIALDCSNPTKLAEFWASVLGYEVARASDDGERVWLFDPQGKSPSLLLHRVAEPKTTKNRMHLDVYVTWDIPAEEAKPIVDVEAARLCAMGATRLRTFEADDYFIVMCDPEGNEFCVA